MPKSPVLLLHAYPLNSSQYNSLARALQQSGYPVISPDYKNFKYSSLEDLAQHILNTLPSTPIHALGLSMGGYVLMRMLALKPEQFKSLVFANTKATLDTPEGKEKRHKQVERITKEGLNWLPEAIMADMLGEHADPTLQNTFTQMVLSSTPTEIIAMQNAMIERPESVSVLATTAQPTLLIAATHDKPTPPQEMQYMQSLLKNSAYLELPTYHLSNLTLSTEFNTAVLQFLEHHV